ncbi:MAG TPA: CBS domain-containing protein [Actinobacteria bacterium]|nr:CBS domain-containing protein [Actinomycetota bacterium]
MFYLTQMLGKPVVDAAGEVIGEISDIAIATGEVFPRVTSLAFLGPDKTPFMLSWRKFVASLEDERVQLNAERAALRFSYLQPDEVLLARDLLNKQIVDTQGMKVVRVNDLKLSESRNQLRLLGAEVGTRGILRGLHPAVERAAASVMRLLGRELSENLIAWNYMDLLDRDLSHVRLSITHKRLHELHPADVADVLEQLHPSQRARVFEHLDNVQAALTVAELEDEFQADLIGDLGDQRASDILEEMDPDDAADIIGDLPYDKAEALLRLMGVSEAQAIRSLLGYREKTAGGIMTPEVTTLTDDMTVQGVIDKLRTGAAEHESIYYIYVVDDDRRLEGVVSLRDLVMSEPDTLVTELIQREVITVNPDDDQELVAETMSKYDLLALPVIDETGILLGIVTIDDALDVLEEESAEDLAIATGAAAEHGRIAGWWWWLVRRNAWLLVWAVAFLAYISLRTPLTRLVADGGSAARAGTLLMGWAVVILPLLLRTAEDLSSRTLAELIEGDAGEERPSLGARLLREGGIGLVTAALSALVAFGLAFLLLGGVDPAATPFALSTAVAALITALAGGVLGHLAVQRSAAGKTVSGTGLSVMTMLLSAVVYLTLAYAAGSLGSVPGSGA